MCLGLQLSLRDTLESATKALFPHVHMWPDILHYEIGDTFAGQILHSSWLQNDAAHILMRCPQKPILIDTNSQPGLH